MAWTLVDSDVAAFADGGAGHVFEFGAAPNVGDIDILFANSDTVVSTPTDFTCPSGASQVNNQGAYGYYRQAVGGESDDVTITTSGNHPAVVGWQRWRGGSGFDVAVGAQISATIGGTTPALDTGTLAGTGELVVVAALLHRLATPTPSAPVWSSGYTPLSEVTQGSGTAGVTQFTAYRTDAGTAAETPSCTWTDGAFDRYAIAMVFTPAAGVDARSGTGTISATATLTSTGTAGRAGTGSTSAAATLTSSGTAGRAGTGSTSASATLSSTGAAGRRGSGQISATATLTSSSGAASRAGTGLLAVATTLTASGFKGASGTGSISVTAILTSGGPRGPGTLTPSTTGSTLTASTRASSTLTITRTP